MKVLILLVCMLTFLRSNAQEKKIVHFTVRLKKVESRPPSCGIFAWALTQKFEIIESDLSFMKKNYPVLLHQRCPELLGDGFFLPGAEYKVSALLEEDDGKKFNLINPYKKENLPSFWIEKIELIKLN